MTYTFTQKETSQILVVDSLINEYENRKILDEIDEFILDDQVHYIIDLGEMSYMNSAGFNFLIAVLTKSRNAGGETVVCNISEQISKHLVMMKLKNVFIVKDSLEEALEELKVEEIEKEQPKTEELKTEEEQD